MAGHQVWELDDLYESVSDYGKTAAFSGLLQFIVRNPYLAPFNAALIYMQRPGSTYVATAQTWAKKGRQIKPGAQPLIRMVRFGPVGFCYDISQTDGPASVQAEPLLQQARQAAALNVDKFKQLLFELKFFGIKAEPFHYENGEAVGSLQAVSWPEYVELTSETTISKLHVFFLLRYEQNASRAEQMATIVHELGHFFCGHLPDPLGKKDKKGKEINRRYEKLTEAQQEFEAESVSWLVCKRLGISTRAERYLAYYAQQNEAIPRVSPEIILKAAGKIEALMREDYRGVIPEGLVAATRRNPAYHGRVVQGRLFRRV